MYRGIWRYASVPDVQRIALAVGVSTLMIALALVMLPHQEPPVPRSVMLLDPLLLILMLGGSRLGYRVWKERRLRGVLGATGKPVLILGAGDTAVGCGGNGHTGRIQRTEPHGNCGYTRQQLPNKIAARFAP